MLLTRAVGPSVREGPADLAEVKVPPGFNNVILVSPNSESLVWIPWPSVDEDSSTILHLDIVTGVYQDRALPVKVGTEVLPVVSSSKVLLDVVFSGGSLSVVSISLNTLRLGRIGGLLDDYGRYDLRGLSASGDGHVLGCSSRDDSTVMDLLSEKVIFAVKGSFLRLAPSGRAIAYLDSAMSLCLRDLTSGKTRRMSGHDSIIGLACWSPDGKYLLAIASSWFGFRRNLIVIDVDEGQTAAVIGRVGEDDRGQQCCWISNQLVRLANSRIDRIDSAGHFERGR